MAGNIFQMQGMRFKYLKTNEGHLQRNKENFALFVKILSFLEYYDKCNPV